MSVPILGVVNFRRLRKLGGFIEVPYRLILILHLPQSWNSMFVVALQVVRDLPS